MTPNTLTQRGVVTRDKMAADFNVTPETVARWEQEYGFPTLRVGDQVFHDVEEVISWMRRRRRR